MQTGLTFLCVVAPGVLSWLSGLRTRRLLDDPTLPERLAAKRRWNLWVLTVAWALLMVLDWRTGVLWCVLAVVGLLVGTFPLRRVLFEETWSLWSYLVHIGKFAFLMVGPWVGVLMMAWVPLSDPLVFGLTAAGVIGAAGWLALNSAPVALRVLDAVPLADPHLLPRLEGVLAKARTHRPVVARAGARGGTWVNGFAVGGRRPVVLLTDGLLEALDPDETTAIFAHEVAHLEEFGLWRWRIRVLAPIVSAAVFATVLLVWLTVRGSVPFPSGLGWPIALILAGLVVGRGTRERESESDRRAVELTGDPHALIRALTKLHTIARLPRRQAANVESRSSHPSLARRIQTIREEGGISVSEGVEPTPDPLLVKDARNPERGVAILADRVAVLEGIGSSEARDVEGALKTTSKRVDYPFAELSELLLTPVRGKLRLRLVPRDAKPIEVGVLPSDAAILQEALDRVDSRLGAGSSGHQANLRKVVPLVAALASILSMVSWAAALASLLAALRPSRPLLWSAALAALLAGAWAGLGPTLPFGPTPLYAVLIGAAGLTMAAMAWVVDPAQKTPGPAFMDRFVPLGLLGLGLLVGAPNLWALEVMVGSSPAAGAAAHLVADPLLLILTGGTALWLTRRESRRRSD